MKRVIISLIFFFFLPFSSSSFFPKKDGGLGVNGGRGLEPPSARQ